MTFGQLAGFRLHCAVDHVEETGVGGERATAAHQVADLAARVAFRDDHAALARNVIGEKGSQCPPDIGLQRLGLRTSAA